jgi:hypothetical protein
VLVAPTTSTTKASIRFATFLCEICASFLSKRGKLVGVGRQSNLRRWARAAQRDELTSHRVLRRSR